jgi:hypothetical protein
MASFAAGLIPYRVETQLEESMFASDPFYFRSGHVLSASQLAYLERQVVRPTPYRRGGPPSGPRFFDCAVQILHSNFDLEIAARNGRAIVE